MPGVWFAAVTTTSATGLAIVIEDPGSSEIQSLLARSARAVSALESIYGRAGSSDLLQMVASASETQRKEGSWGSDDDPRMKPCFTAQMIDALLAIGPRYRWSEGSMLGPYPSREITRAIDWLLGQQSPDGQWGEDLWDTSEVLRTLIAAGVPQDQHNVRRGVDRVVREVEAGWPDRSSYWFGPGYMGGVLELLNLIGDETHAEMVVSSILAYQDLSTGCFSFPEGSVARAPNVWQTSCALLGLRSCGSIPPEPERVKMAYDWLRKAQDPSGCWSPGHADITSYVTRQAVAALVKSDGQRGTEAQRGAEWFLDLWRDNRNAVGLSHTLMGASALARTHAQDLYGSVGYVFLREISDLVRTSSEMLRLTADEIEQVGARVEALAAEVVPLRESASQVARLEADRVSISQERDSLRHDVTRLENTLQRYALRLTANQLTVFGAIMGVVGVLLAIFLA